MHANRTILQRKYARIINLFAQSNGLPNEAALDFFFNSKTYELLDAGIADMHCMSDEYLAEELAMEYTKMLHGKQGTTP